MNSRRTKSSPSASWGSGVCTSNRATVWATFSRCGSQLSLCLWPCFLVLVLGRKNYRNPTPTGNFLGNASLINGYYRFLRQDILAVAIWHALHSARLLQLGHLEMAATASSFGIRAQCFGEGTNSFCRRINIWFVAWLLVYWLPFFHDRKCVVLIRKTQMSNLECKQRHTHSQRGSSIQKLRSKNNRTKRREASAILKATWKIRMVFASPSFQQQQYNKTCKCVMPCYVPNEDFPQVLCSIPPDLMCKNGHAVDDFSFYYMHICIWRRHRITSVTVGLSCV